MAIIHDLLAQIQDPILRQRLNEEVLRLSKNKKFGLVFEEHMPECTPLYGVNIRAGMNAARKDGKASDVLNVLKIEDDQALVRNAITGEITTIPLGELVAVAQFGEPVYPTLQPIDSIQNAPDNSLWHTLIEADNYHALQLLEYLYAGKVDCIYIDPPYNTRAKDWKYNNDYVDPTDLYRHSKWLSMMKKRLCIAKRLLKPNAVMMVTIDDNEYAKLILLLEELFPEWKHVTICVQMNPGGTQGKAFSVTNEFVIVLYRDESEIFKRAHLGGDTYNLRRWGSTSNRYEGATCFYPVIIDSEGYIVGFGDVLSDDMHPSAEVEQREDGNFNVWPIDINGNEKKWRYSRNTIETIIDKLFVEKRGSRIEVNVRRETEPPKTMWTSNAYNAEAYGTDVVKAIIGKDQFSYPKSLYAVRDCLALAVSGKRDALILDFFAGSGTTLHAVNLLNTEDNGRRRCILVTNNEVSANEAIALRKKGLAPGDPEWEKYGIARHVTWMRTKHSILGTSVSGQYLLGNYGVEHDDYVVDDDSVVISRATGKPLKRKVYRKEKVQDYPDLCERALSSGLHANVEYFKLCFMDRSMVSLGMQFSEILPLLWLKSGAIGMRPLLNPDAGLPEMLILPKNGFAVLLQEECFSKFTKQLAETDGIHTVFFVTDSDDAYKEMSAVIGIEDTFQLYRSYLDNFSIGGGRTNR